MMKEVTAIIEKDKMLGDLASEMFQTASHENYFAALSCLCVLMEQAIKLSVERNDGNFAALTKEAKEKDLITENESSLIERLRDCRNKMFHESHYCWNKEKDGILYPFSEDETRKLIYKEFSTPCIKVVLKLLKLQEVNK